MELFIVEMARYVIILLFALYTFYSFRAFAGHNKQRQNRVFAAQRTLTLLLHTVMSAILIMENKDIMYVGLWAAEFAFYLIFIKVYQACYKGLSKLVLNNMMMCMMVGFVILGSSSDYSGSGGDGALHLCTADYRKIPNFGKNGMVFCRHRDCVFDAGFCDRSGKIRIEKLDQCRWNCDSAFGICKDIVCIFYGIAFIPDDKI